MHEREDLKRDRLRRRRESRRLAVNDVRNWLLVLTALAVTALAYLALRTG